MKRIVAALAALPLFALQWQENKQGNFEAWDDGNTVKIEMVVSGWNYQRWDPWNQDVLLFPSGQVSLKPILLVNPSEHQVDWVYVYWGDGTGQFVNKSGSALTHTYDDESRYNPTLIAKVDGAVKQLTVMASDGVPAGSNPRPSYNPPTTYNSELNAVLRNLALDNSGIALSQANCYCSGSNGQICRTGGGGGCNRGSMCPAECPRD
jgi:hypothetical protein